MIRSVCILRYLCVKSHLNFGLVLDEFLVDHLRVLVELVQIDDELSIGILGQLIQEDDASSQSIGVCHPGGNEVGQILGRCLVAVLEDHVSPWQVADPGHGEAMDGAVRHRGMAQDHRL